MLDINSTMLPSADSDIKPQRYLNLIKQYMTLAGEHKNPVLYINNINEYEIALCNSVYNAYVGLERDDGPYYGKRAPKKELLKIAMKNGRGVLNPADAAIMIESVRDFYYGNQE